MKKILSISLIALFSTQYVIAQDQQAESEDPFDLSEINDKIEELGIPTVESVSQLELMSDGL